MAFLCQSGTQQTSGSTTQDIIPLFKEPVEDILGEVKKLYESGYQPYDQARIADFTDDQKDLMRKSIDRVGYGEDDIRSGIDRLKGMEAKQFDSAAADQYMNPYLDKVLDRSRKRAFDAYDMARQGRDARAVGAGAFGGDRQFIEEGQASGKMLDRLADQEAKAYSTAYDKAYDAFAKDSDRALKADIGAATGIGSLVGQGQNVFQNQMASAGSAADAQQRMDQAGLDLAYDDFQNQRNFPYEQLSFYNQILQGFPLSMSNTNYTNMSPGPSKFQQGLGLGINALGMYGMGGGFGQAPGGFGFGNLAQNMFPYN
tara:strand:- start:5684 stop:6625 length:942 start_codon:yes stop_codon:yes gene_type:complete